MDGLVTRSHLVRGATDFDGVLAEVRADFERLVATVPAEGAAPPFSPPAYNAIATRVQTHVLDAIAGCAEIVEAPHHNVGLLAFCEIQKYACQQRFEAYERENGLVDPYPEARPLSRARPSLVRRALGRLRWSVARRTDLTPRKATVAYAGNTTVPWGDVDAALRPRGFVLEAVRPRRPLHVPEAGRQRDAIRAALGPLDADADGRDRVVPDAMRIVDTLLASPASWDGPADILLTGTLGNPSARLVAFHARERGIPVLVVHHGAHHLVFEEPYYDLYEGRLVDGKVAYGDVDAQARSGMAGPRTNVAGAPIRLFGRTDREVAAQRPLAHPPPAGSLRGKAALYLGVEFGSGRYGPFRDVHPARYAQWQERLIAWLAQETGRMPTVRLHPKRPSTRYDPRGYTPSQRRMEEDLRLADVVVLDYPTTSLAHAVASGKPVLLFDLGLRRLHPAADRLIRARCHVATCDLDDPQEGFTEMLADLPRTVTEGFAPTCMVAPTDEDEAGAIASAVVAMHEEA